MCGICGVFAIDDTGADQSLTRMKSAMRHRGPDDAGSVRLPIHDSGAGAAVHLGFQRLAIIDTSTAGHQPMHDAASRNWLVFNGEIYNYRELRSALQDRGHVFVGGSDTEVALHALNEWGAEALCRLRGMFAIAFFDATENRLLLARDPLGIKPLYYLSRAGRFVFASEARAILSAGEVGGGLTSEGVAGFLAFGASTEPATVYDGIMMLPAGTYAWIGVQEVRAGGVRPAAFWRLPAAAQDGAQTAGDAAAGVRQVVNEAIQSHLVADVPVSVFLSAGVDSGIIAAVASRLAGPINTFTVGFDLAGHRDEAAGARETADAVGARHHEVVLRTEDVPEMFAAWLRSMDQPSIDGFNSFVVAGAVRNAGFKVALSGLGSDELFGGYPNFAVVAKVIRRQRWLHRLPSGLRDALLAVATIGRSGRKSEALRSLYSKRMDARAVALTMRRVWSDAMIHAALGHVFPEPLAVDVAASPALNDYATACRAVSEAEVTGYMRNVLLRDADVYSMARSLEVRVPFLDTNVVEHVARIPSRLVFDRVRPGKHLLKAAFSGFAPRQIFERPKTGFSLPMGVWMKGPLREQCEASIGRIEASGLMAKHYARDIWRTFLRGNAAGRWMRPMALVALGACIDRPTGNRA